MRNGLWTKGLVIEIIVLFVGTSCIPLYDSVSIKKDVSTGSSNGTPIKNNYIERKEVQKTQPDSLATQESHPSMTKYVGHETHAAIPSFQEYWLHYDNGECTNAIGLSNGETFEGAIRLTPTELGPYNGWILTEVKFYHGTPGFPQPSHSGMIKIYGGGNEITPGELITTENFTTPEGNGWVEVYLSNQVIIHSSHDYWFSVQVTYQTGEYPLGVDPGPAVDGKGDWVCVDGNWSELQSYGLDYNWNIYGLVTGWDAGPNPRFTWTPPDPLPGEMILFNASESWDYSGNIILYEWDWNNDGIYEENHTTPLATHSWTYPGQYYVVLRETDDLGLTGRTGNIVTIVNHAPEKPIINGPTNGTVNHEYTFSLNPITDPDGDSIYCEWKWGDGNITDWLGPYSSGEVIYASHNWSQKGAYEIQVLLKDEYGLKSNWSNPHVINIFELKKKFIFGRYANMTAENEFITVEAVHLQILQFRPFKFEFLIAPERITFSSDYVGLKTKRFIAGVFDVVE